ncbi:MAG: PDZ domain-containing protein [Planctomycetota bacterium]|nr:PDZ domain-containing protein [Planctomycetota bacterium]
MNRFVAASLLALALSGAARAQDLRQDIDHCRRKVYPALVNISVVVRTFSDGRSQRSPAAGSGVIVSPAGHVLTNFHVVGHTTRITCTLPDGEAIDADVVWHDPLTDLSVLALRLQARKQPARPLPFATLGDSAALQVGEHVLAMGNPLSLSSSLTLGVVSNTGRVFTNFTGTDIEELDLGEGEVTGLFTRWIQHDALILPGNSGGPLVNLRGEVVGINELGGGGVGFAIPSNLAAHVLNEALTHGEVRRGWLGASFAPVQRLGLEQGALVANVAAGSPAARAGVRPGDLLLALDDQPVVARFFEQVPELYQRLAALAPGRVVRLTLQRKGDTLPLDVTLGRMEPALGEQAEVPQVGMTLRDVTGPMAMVRRWPDADGVLITGLRPGFPFEDAKPDVRAGDVIVSLDGRPVVDLAGFHALWAELSGKEQLRLGYRRGQESLLTLVKPDRKRPTAQGGALRRAWLGVKAQVLTSDLAQALGLAGTRGFRVTEVFPWTEAARAGLLVGDVITAVGGQALEAHRPRDAQELKLTVERQPLGKPVEVAVVRGAERLALQVVMQESPGTATEARGVEVAAVELKARELTFIDRVEQRWPEEVAGVLVTEATPGGWAAMAGLRAGDLVVSVEDQPTPDPATFEQVMARALEARPRVVRFFVRRGPRTTFVFMEPDWGAAPR